MKSAVSLPIDLFQEVDRLCKKIKLTRSRLFTLAIQDFIQKYQNKKMLNELNQVYAKQISNDDDLELTRRWFIHQNRSDGEKW